MDENNVVGIRPGVKVPKAAKKVLKAVAKETANKTAGKVSVITEWPQVGTARKGKGAAVREKIEFIGKMMDEMDEKSFALDDANAAMIAAQLDVVASAMLHVFFVFPGTGGPKGAVA